MFIHHHHPMCLSVQSSPSSFFSLHFTERAVDPHKYWWKNTPIWFLFKGGFCWSIQLWENNNKITTKMTNTFQICLEISPSGIWSHNKNDSHCTSSLRNVCQSVTLSVARCCFPPWREHRGDYWHFSPFMVVECNLHLIHVMAQIWYTRIVFPDKQMLFIQCWILNVNQGQLPVDKVTYLQNSLSVLHQFKLNLRACLSQVLRPWGKVRSQVFISKLQVSFKYLGSLNANH